MLWIRWALTNAASRVSVILLAAAVIPACSMTGDFGRTEPTFIQEHIVPVARTAVREIRGVLTSDFDYTPDEEALRARSGTLLNRDRRWSLDRFLGAMIEDVGVADSRYETSRRVTHNTGASVYEHRLPSRTAQTLLGYLYAEVSLAEQFGDVADRVYQADARRRDDLLYGGEVSGDEIHNTTARIKSNRRVTRRTVLALRNRIDDYRLELRKSRLEHPDYPDYGVLPAIDRYAATVDALEDRLRTWPFPEDDVIASGGRSKKKKNNRDLLGG